MALRDIDMIIDAMRAKHPGVGVTQLKVKYPADDDGIWFFSRPGCPFEVQLESSLGSFPFVVETDRHNQHANSGSLSEAMHFIELWLDLSASG